MYVFDDLDVKGIPYLLLHDPIGLMIPLTDNNEVLQFQDMMKTPCEVDAELIGALPDGSYIKLGKMFKAVVGESLPYTNIPEVTDPKLDLIYAQWKAEFDQFKKDLAEGKYKGEKGDTYEITDKDYDEIASKVDLSGVKEELQDDLHDMVDDKIALIPPEEEFEVYTTDEVYTKDEVDDLLDDKLSHADVYTKEQTLTLINESVINKANVDDVYTREDTDRLIENSTKNKADLRDVYTKSQTEAVIDEKLGDIDLSEIEHKISILDGETLDIYEKLEHKVGESEVYTKAQVEHQIEDKVGLEEPEEEVEFYDKSEVDYLLSLKATHEEVTTMQHRLDTEIDGKQDELIAGDHIEINGSRISVNFDYVESTYSALPIKCGVWIDGKQIKRRVYVVANNIAKGNQIKVANKPSDMDLLIRGWGVVIGAADATKHTMTNSEITVYVNNDGIYTVNNFTGYAERMYIIIEYTIV